MNTLRNNRNQFLPFGFDLLPKFETMGNTQNQLPAVNIKENDHQFEILLAVPGLNKKDFKIVLFKSQTQDGTHTMREFLWVVSQYIVSIWYGFNR